MKTRAKQSLTFPAATHNRLPLREAKPPVGGTFWFQIFIGHRMIRRRELIALLGGAAAAWPLAARAPAMRLSICAIIQA
jgi:hypothetical protein